MKINVVMASIALLSSALIGSEAFASNQYRVGYSADIQIAANSTGQAEVVKEKEPILKEYTLYDYGVDSWRGHQHAHAGYYWANIAGGCGFSGTETTVQIVHSNLCWRSLYVRATNTPNAFVINPEEDFEISFNTYRDRWGTHAIAFMEGDGHEIFEWKYGSESYFRTPVGKVAINDLRNDHYRIEKKGSVMRMYVNGEIVGEGSYTMPHTVNLETRMGVHNSRMHFSNLSVKVSRPE